MAGLMPREALFQGDIRVQENRACDPPQMRGMAISDPNPSFVSLRGGSTEHLPLGLWMRVPA